MRVMASRGTGMSRLRWPVSGSLMRRPLSEDEGLLEGGAADGEVGLNALAARAWRLREESWRSRSTTLLVTRGWSRGLRIWTERSLSARGRGSTVVVTVTAAGGSLRSGLLGRAGRV